MGSSSSAGMGSERDSVTTLASWIFGSAGLDSLLTGAVHLAADFQSGSQGLRVPHARSPSVLLGTLQSLCSLRVPRAGLEPARHCCQGILSPRCLPFHHPGLRRRYHKNSRPSERVGCMYLRPERESNPRMGVLQTPVLPLHHRAIRVCAHDSAKMRPLRIILRQAQGA